MSVRRNQNGKWFVDIKGFRHPDGRIEPRIRKVSPVQTKRGAERFEREIRQSLAEGTYGKEPEPEPEPIPTVREFAQEFMDIYAENNNKRSEINSKWSILRHHIFPYFGARRLDEVRTRDVESFKARQRRNGLKNKTINNELTVLRSMLRLAKKWEIIESVPTIDQLPIKEPEWDFLDFDEADRLLAAAKEEPEWHAMILLALRTGLRQGEILGLEWDDVDLVAGRIRVARRFYKGDIDSPKGGRSRTVPMSDELQRVLRAHRARTALRGKLVWTSPEGGYLKHNGVKRPLDRVRKRAGLRVVGWHMLRHTFASHLAMRGVPMAVIQKLLGHNDIRTTMRYAHLSPQIKDDAVRLLDEPAPRLGHCGGIEGGARAGKAS